MKDRDRVAKTLDAQSLKAAYKIKRQQDVVERVNDSEHPEERRLLQEMQENKVVIDVNRALCDYGSDDPKAD